MIRAAWVLSPYPSPAAVPAAMVGAVLYEGRRPGELVPELMLREAKAELHGFS